ncbi:unnamed protein product [Sphenostylis stenocarpa]|uniref:Uncharacterized protein n=1 Tax=Sphenostylis stenocarpa TaxID=92480 RepID=A0AA86VT91_9FABA|nr:unnamed protein product [Sphenostylis stenocarpa]
MPIELAFSAPVGITLTGGNAENSMILSDLSLRTDCSTSFGAFPKILRFRMTCTLCIKWNKHTVQIQAILGPLGSQVSTYTTHDSVTSGKIKNVLAEEG